MLGIRKRRAEEELETSEQKRVKKFSEIGYADRRRGVLIDDDNITFLVRGVLIRTQKSSLATLSQVFFAMLFGLLNKPGDIIRIDDCDPEAFQILINYKGAFEKSYLRDMPMDLVLNLFYCSHKYGVTSVEEQVFPLIKDKLEPKNVLLVIPWARVFGWSFIESKCWYIIEWNAKKVMESEAFLGIDFTTLCLILENSRLRISEFELFQRVLTWAERVFERESNKWENIQGAIGVAIYKIRFPLMTPIQFKNVIDTKILRRAEIVDILRAVKGIERLSLMGRRRSSLPTSSIYINKPRRFVCACRKNRENCIMCCGNKVISVVDGISRRNVTDFYSSSDSDWEPSCECSKYNSCPAYPNGKIALLKERPKKCNSGKKSRGTQTRP